VVGATATAALVYAPRQHRNGVQAAALGGLGLLPDAAPATVTPRRIPRRSSATQSTHW